MKQDCEKKIKEYFSKKTKISVEELDIDIMMSEYGITSLQFLEYIVEIEDIFEIKFSERDLNNIYSINDLIKCVEGKKSNERD